MKIKHCNTATQTDHPASTNQPHSTFRTYDNNYDDNEDDESEDSPYIDGSPPKPKIIFQNCQDDGIFPNFPNLTQQSPRFTRQSRIRHFPVKCESDDWREFEQGFKKLTEIYSIFNVSIIRAHDEICGELEIRKTIKEERMFHELYYRHFKYAKDTILPQIEKYFKQISDQK